MSDTSRAKSIQASNFELAVEAPQAAGASPRIKRLLVLALTLILGLAVLVVIFLLPNWVAQSGADSASNAADTVVQASDDSPSAENPSSANETADAANKAERETPQADPKARENTQEKLRETLEKLSALEAIEGDQWAKGELFEIRQKIAEGEKAYREKRYVTATNIYLDTSAKVDRLLAEVPDLVQRLNESGTLALAQGDSAAATQAFEQVLRMASDDEAAARGLKRAETLDQVLALVEQAEGYERLGQTAQAIAAYRQALKLDKEAPGATAAIQRIGRDQREDAVRAHMSEGFKALAAERFAQARAAFQQASKLDSNRDDVKDALKQVDNAEASYHIAKQLAEARQAVREERWGDAEKAFAAALKHDERLTPALNGRQQAKTRHRLDGHITSLLAKPERLSSNSVHAEATQLLASARALKADGPRITQQIAQLSRALELARTPLNVPVSSDGATEVTIYKVGELGRFTQREVSLLPGNYTIVGTRDGYRDVRVELRLRHGTALNPLTIQCQEPIAAGN